MNNRTVVEAGMKTMAVLPFAHKGVDPTLESGLREGRKEANNRFPIVSQQLSHPSGQASSLNVKVFNKHIAYVEPLGENDIQERGKSTLDLPIKNTGLASRQSHAEKAKVHKDLQGDDVPSDFSRQWAPSGIIDEYIPADIWNHVVSKHVPTDYLLQPPHLVHNTQGVTTPFGVDRSRHYVNSTLKKLMSKATSEAHVRSASVPLLPSKNAKLGAVYDTVDGPCMRPDAPPTRMEAVLLREAYDEMTANVRSQYGGGDPLVFVPAAARNADANKLLNLIEPEFYVLDVTMTELVNQVRIGCQERGNLLERCRTRILEIFSASSFGIKELGMCHEKQQLENSSLLRRIRPLEDELQSAKQQILQLESQIAALKVEVDALGLNLQEAEKLARMNSDGQFISKSQREKGLEEQLHAAEQLNDLLRSKIVVLESELLQNRAAQEVLRCQVLQLQERVRRDAEKFDVLSESLARRKLAQFWLRTIAFMRRAPRSNKEQCTQDGDGIGTHLSSADDKADRIQTPPEERKRREAAALKNRVVSRETFVGQVIAYSAFWGSVVKQAENVDFGAKPKLQMAKNSLLEFICKIYMEKILFDEIDDRTRLPRQTLPEFLYVYHLEVFGQPQLAYEALVNIVANVRVYDRSSLRIKMFSRFLNLGGQPFPLEALNIFLVSLVKLQNGQVPLLADTDGIQVESARALRVVEYIFAQAPAVVRAKVMQGAEKLSSGRSVDVDAFLLFIIDTWKEEAGRAEERLRALFVASDIDGDGNLDITEFTQMVDHVNVGKGHRELMRMYAEMTLDQQVDCNTFVRVCRKFRFFTFEVGPAIKKSDPGVLEVFALLNIEWKKMEEVVHEVLVVLQGTPIGKRLAQLVTALKRMLSEKLEVELAWHMFRTVVSGFMTATKKQPPIRAP